MRRAVVRAPPRAVQRAPALSHSSRSDYTVDNYAIAAGKRPPVPAKHGDVARDGVGRSRGWGGCCSWGWLSAPAFRFRVGHCVPPPMRAREAQLLEARSFHGMASWLLQIGCLWRSERPIRRGTTT